MVVTMSGAESRLVCPHNRVDFPLVEPTATKKFGGKAHYRRSVLPHHAARDEAEIPFQFRDAGSWSAISHSHNFAAASGGVFLVALPSLRVMQTPARSTIICTTQPDLASAPSG
jgi:hypothetical protein